ncbi:MAG TPA: gamma-glutamyltransferase [Xanthobacteraceae bacterium]|nr:gamma-glutamyltransferase [Xanthobacteraceae bacterium]
MKSHRPTIMGTHHMIAATQYLAAEAGFKILEAGGNAIDAGVAAGIALGVVQPEFVNVAGVAPIIIYSAVEDRIVTIPGLGTWPKAIDRNYFKHNHGGKIPQSIMRTVVPAAPDAWITALERFGTMSFGEVARSAIGYARDGFPVYPLMSEVITEHEAEYRAFPSNVALYLPKGRPPRPGEIFVQSALAATLQHMADEEKAARGRGRDAGLAAARDAFYRGDIARAIVKHQKENGGLLSADDLASYRSGFDAPAQTSFGDIRLYACGPWCQGPSLLQAINLLDAAELRKLGHNSTGYLHHITEAVKLAFADREAYFGDPRVVDVPIDALLSREYATKRREMIRPDKAWPEMPPAGDPRKLAAARAAGAPLEPERAFAAPELDTSHVCCVDKHGNVFAATPSDGSYNAPVIPELGIIPSPRGSQSWGDPDHPSGVAPGKRPRLTPSPAIAIEPGKMKMPFGTPGGDVQTQAMLQVFLNIHLFGMETQEAVEAPRVASYSFPSSFEPHAYHPGLLRMESRIDRATGEALGRLGHTIDWWPEWTWLAGAVCAVVADLETGVLKGGADPRRPSYALGL